MKITDSQIQELYTFTRQHFVEFYDLQTELVDHLANAIENSWQKQPKLSFEEAKAQSFKKFGVFGFMEVVEARQKAMGKKYYKYLWGHLKQWFLLPQLALTLSIFLGFYILFSTTYGTYYFMSIFLVLSGWALYKGYTLKKKHKTRIKVTRKNWLLQDLIFKQASGVAIIFICQILNTFNLFNILEENVFTNVYINIAVSAFLTLTILCSYISLVLLPSKAESLLKETYPEYSL